MALIDKETIRAEIERLKENAESAKKEWNDGHYNQNAFAEDCRIISFNKLLAFIDTLPDEDGEEKFRNLLDAMGDCGFSQDDILLLKSIWEDAGCQIPQREQPVEGLEEEIRHYCKVYYNFNYPEQIGTGSSIMPHIIEAARHFAEWQKAKMMKEAVEGKVAERIQGKLYARCKIPNTMEVEFCDKVKVIFVKEDN